MDLIEKKATLCRQCINKPCSLGCPLHNDIPGFISLIRKKKYHDAYNLLCETTVLQSVCGRVCPHERQCQGTCAKFTKDRPVPIGKLEVFLGDMAVLHEWDIPMLSEVEHRKKVLVIGGGPAGLTCAAFLRRHGIDVTIYEKHNYLGGLLEHGIPEFRLNKKLLKKVIQKILDLGVKVELNKEFGKDFKLSDIEEEYDAIFLGFGANVSNKLGVVGEELNGVYGGNELLEAEDYPDFKNKVVAVDGGGNTAMDVARVVKKLGAKEVIIIYRRGFDDMSADDKELMSVRRMGISFLLHTAVKEVVGTETVEKIKLVTLEKDSEGHLVEVNGSEKLLKVDSVIMAVGSHADPKLTKLTKVNLDDKGKIDVDRFYHTSNPKIFAGGDLAGVKGTVAWAASSGRTAAYEIIKYLGYEKELD